MIASGCVCSGCLGPRRCLDSRILRSAAELVGTHEEAALRQRLEPPGHIETIRRPEDNRGIWIRYDGTRWNALEAVPFDPARHSRIGDYFGFPVYSSQGSTEIFIPAWPGMLTAYQKDPGVRQGPAGQ